nr:MAG TPA: hypothetical protein [Caudoviricetes sp.]
MVPISCINIYFIGTYNIRNQNLGNLLSTWDYLTDSIAGKGTTTTESITLSRPLSRYKF